MKIMFTFPGQGTQKAGMLHQLPDSASVYLQQASKVLKTDVLTLDSAQSLQSTRNVQLCLFISGVIYANALISQGIMPDLVAGLSIGAFPAAVIAGCLCFEDALKIVAKRGELMEHAYPTGYGMAAIIGLDRFDVEKLVTDCFSDDNPVYVANINADKQMIISGKKEALERVCQLARLQGASKTTLLNIQIPSHCALMTKPAKQLFNVMRSYPIHTPTIAYMSGSTGRLYTKAEQILDDLAYNMQRQTLWYETANASYERGIRLTIEMPPGNTLTQLSKSLMPLGEAVALDNTSLETIRYLAKIHHGY